MRPEWLLLSSTSSSSPASTTCFCLSPHKLNRQHHPRPFPAPAIPFPTTTTHESPHLQCQTITHLQLTKRKLSLSLFLAFPCTAISVFFSAPSTSIADEIDKNGKALNLDKYTDTTQGFALLIPSSWVKVDKAGATVLFQDVNNGTNNIGVVVSPVRLDSLGKFGTPQFVADKLIQAEKRKESTKDVEVIVVAERVGNGGLQVYEFEYKLDSTRGGMKRIFSAAFVASKKLYLLNIAYSDRPESPLDTSTKMMLEQILHSFDAASLA